MSDTMISFNLQELEFLQDLLAKEGKICRKSLLALGRWTDRLEKYTDILQGLIDKVEEAQNVNCLDKRMAR